MYAPRDPLREWARMEISLNQLRIMAMTLPPDNPVSRAAAGTHWRDTDYHLAELNDRVGDLLAVTVAANSDGNGTVQPPPRMWRPSSDDDKRQDEELKEEQVAKHKSMSAALLRNN